MIAALPARDRAPRRVLVTGGSGHIGRHVVNGLVARGALVRTLTRRPGRSVQRHVEAVRGDLCDPATMRRALAGMDALFLIWPLLETEPAEPLVDTIGRSSVRVVYVSSTAVVDSAANQSDPIVQVHADMEALLTMAGVRTLMLRSDTLACNALGWASQVAASDVVRGQDVASTAVVDERDVAAAAITVLLARPDHPLRSVYLLTGPELLSRADQVRILGAGLGRRLRFEPQPPSRAREQLLASGYPVGLVEALIEASVHRPASTVVTRDVHTLVGREAGTFEQWVRDHTSAFTADVTQRPPTSSSDM